MLNTHELISIFAEEIADHGGTVRESFDDGRRLFVRSVLPQEQEIRRGDRVQGGVALRANDGEIFVSPYVFRQVCTNGAIFAQAVQTRRLVVEDLDAAIGIEWPLREAVRACCATEAFDQSAGEMRASVDPAADLMLTVMPIIARMRPLGSSFLTQIFQRFTRERRHTRYELMNAVTSVARDTKDPGAKWRLEELGGAIAAETPRPAFEAIRKRLESRMNFTIA